MHIGAVAGQADVGVETIRFYERKGLIDRPLRPKDGGFRIYPPETVGRICFIRQAQDLGFSLKEITELLSLRADPSTDCEAVRNQAQEKLKEVNRKIAQLNRIRAGLKGLIAACPGEGGLQSCSIMEALESGDSALANHQSSRRR